MLCDVQAVRFGAVATDKKAAARQHQAGQARIVGSKVVVQADFARASW
jgi:hypothetical protein